MQIFQIYERKNSLLAKLCGIMVLIIIFIPNVAGGGTGVVTQNPISDEQMYSAPIEIRKPFDEIIQRKADEYQVSFDKISAIIDCENKDRDPSLQSRMKYTEGQISRNQNWGVVGEREKSFGLVQIHLPAHPTISKQQAIDPEFSIDFLAKHLSLGNGRWWTCYS